MTNNWQQFLTNLHKRTREHIQFIQVSGKWTVLKGILNEFDKNGNSRVWACQRIMPGRCNFCCNNLSRVHYAFDFAQSFLLLSRFSVGQWVTNVMFFCDKLSHMSDIHCISISSEKNMPLHNKEKRDLLF